jgi:formate dehydrogenase subunit gamma
MVSARLVGVIAAITLVLLFVAVLIRSLGPNEIVVPTNGVTAGGPRDNPAGVGALAELKARAEMQRWPGATTTPPPATLSLGPPASGPVAPREGLPQEWWADREKNRDILDQPAYREGRSSLPEPVRDVLMQPQGRTWRDLHNDKLAYGGAIYVFGISLLIALFLAVRGRIEVAEGESGETVRRFSAFERANHWLTAVSFLLLAGTGLVILYGNGLIRPWLGAGPYAQLARFSAWSHMTFAMPFVLGVLVMIALWTRQNLFERLDWEWLKRGGGFIGRAHPPARKFNAGQKLVFWGVALGGLGLALTGLGLMFPFYWAGYTGMEVAQSVHTALALLMIGLIVGHIYIGTIGMQGAFEAMWSGRVDRNWAREHHRLWLEEAAAREVSPRAQAGGRRAGALTSFVAGAAVAVVLALIMVGVLETAGSSTAQREARSNPFVHLTDPATRVGKARE